MAALLYQTKISQQSTFKKKHRRRVFPGGDGASQRIRDGLNATYWEGSIVYNALTEAEADALVAFLDDLGSCDTFDYQPPQASAAVKFVTTEDGISIGVQNGNLWTVSFDVKQEFA